MGNGVLVLGLNEVLHGKSKRKKARLVCTQVDERDVKVDEHHKGTRSRSVYSRFVVARCRPHK